MHKTFGYARVSTDDQDCSVQVAALQAAGCERVFQEQRSGTSRNGREALADLISRLRPGDTVMVTRIDRLARSVVDLMQIVDDIRKAGAELQATEQAIAGGAAGEAFLGMLGVFAQFETAIRRERQMEGIAKAKAAGVYKGRKPSVPVDEVRRLVAEGVTPTEIAKRLGIGRASVYRAMEARAA